MAIQKLSIQQFLDLSQYHPVLDVRSPGEYMHAHIPNAINIPLFSNEERKIVGTAYKQQSREEAIKIGLDFFGVKMKTIVEDVEKIEQQHILNQQEKAKQSQNDDTVSKCILLHCWRGGMRSAAIAWLLDLYGFTVYTLTGGYKAYRHWVLMQLDKDYTFSIIGGYTGSGKTPLLRELKLLHYKIIDLEALANHKGSAFGFVGRQPSQEMFENLLACGLYQNSELPPGDIKQNEMVSQKESIADIFVEDESQRIGNLKIPDAIWNRMRSSNVFFIDIPFEERLQYITQEYGKLEKESLINAIMRIQKRLGGLETRNALQHLAENNIIECFRILLRYYDKWYSKGLHSRENISSFLNKVPCKSVDTKSNAQNLLACATVHI